MKVLFFKAFKSLVLLSLTMIVNVASAAQQQWASQYVSWHFDNAVTDVYNIDQQVWLPEPNNASFWPLQWEWQGAAGVGGYLGLQQLDESSQQVRFSLWNATDAIGSHCATFGGEGIGYSCTLPLVINTNKFYRLRLWRTEAENDGQWWSGWLIESDGNGTLIEHHIGEIKVPLAYNQVEPTSINNFVEFWGDEVSNCNEVPLSVIGFTPPAINFQGDATGVYDSNSTYAGSNRAPGNLCQEGNGASITAEPYNFGFANGVMMFLGGAYQNHSLTVDSVPLGLPFITSAGGQCDGLIEWDNSSVYTAGNIVQHNGIKYTANWWSAGNNPVQYSEPWQVWTSNGSCL